MNFSFDMNRSSDILDEIERNMDSTTLAGWCNKIEILANQLCSDTSDKIIFEYGLDKQLTYWAKDEKSRDCLIKAIESLLNSAPLFLKDFLKFAIERIKEMKFNP